MLFMIALVSFNPCFFALVNLNLALALALQPQVRNPTIALSFLLTLHLVTVFGADFTAEFGADFGADFGAESVADSAVDSVAESVVSLATAHSFLLFRRDAGASLLRPD